MAKYLCNVYYEYVYTVEVEADNENDAFDKAFDISQDATIEDLDYVGYNGGNVATLVNGKVDLDTIVDMD